MKVSYRIQKIPVRLDNDGSEAREKVLREQFRPLMRTSDSLGGLQKAWDRLARELRLQEGTGGPEFLLWDSLEQWPPKGSRTWSPTDSHPFAPRYEPIWPAPFWKNPPRPRK